MIAQEELAKKLAVFANPALEEDGERQCHHAQNDCDRDAAPDHLDHFSSLFSDEKHTFRGFWFPRSIL